jgi:hypothetical protein
MLSWRSAGRAIREERKQFFFEKKEPKNFCESGPSLSGEAEAKTNKSFLLLFFKKDVLAFSYLCNSAASPAAMANGTCACGFRPYEAPEKSRG